LKEGKDKGRELGREISKIISFISEFPEKVTANSLQLMTLQISDTKSL
jgi:hypothetical protein